MKSILYIMCLVFSGSMFSSTRALAVDLNLNTGSAEVLNATSVSLQNLLLDEQFYNAVIQLNLDGTYDVLSAAETQIDSTVKYKVVFDSSWSSSTHPDQFPGGQAHLSGLVGATHRSDFKLWQLDQLATPGIESMAETGSKAVLISEINAALGSADAEFLLSGGGVGSSPGSVSLSFTVSQAYPFVSLVSMIAPSPDWFVGVSGLSLIENGQWVEELVVPLFAYDAGTDNGGSYTSQNSDTNPPATISRLKVPPFRVDGETAALGRFIFRRQ